MPDRRCYICGSNGRPITEHGRGGEPKTPQYHLNNVHVKDNSKRGYSCLLVCDEHLEKGQDDED